MATALAAGAVLLAGTEAARAYAEREAARAIRRELGMNTQIGDVYVDVRRLAVVARDIRVDHPEHGRFVEATTLRIRPSLWALLTGKLDLQGIDIEQATVTLVVRDERVINAPRIAESSGDSPELDLPFRGIAINDSRLVVDASPHARGELDRIDIDLDSTRSDQLRFHVSSSGGWVEHEAGREELSRLELLGRLSAKQIEIEQAHLVSAFARASVRRGVVPLPLRDEYEGDVDIDVDVAHVASWPHGYELPPLEGHLRLQGRVAKRYGQHTGDGTITLRDGRIENYGLGEELRLRVQADEQQIEFRGTTRLIRLGGQVGLEGRLKLDEGYPLEATLDLQNLSFAKLMEQLSVTPDAIVSWLVSGPIELRGTLEPLQLSGPLRLSTRDLVITRDAWHAQPSRFIFGIPRAELRGTAAVRPDGIHFEQTRANFGTSSVTASVLIGFDNQLRVNGIGTDVSLADCSPLLDFPLRGRGELVVDMSGTLQDPVTKGRIQFDDFAFNTFGFGDVKSEFQLEHDSQAVRFPLLHATKRDSTYRAVDLVLDFRSGRFRADGDLEIERLTMADFYRVFNRENDERFTPYQGVVTGESHIEYTLGFPDDGPAGTMVADIDVDIPQANLRDYQFTDGSFRGRWNWLDHRKGADGGELAIRHFSLRKGAGTVHVSGRMGLEGALDMVAVADRISIRETEGLADRLPALGGTWSVTGSIGGTVDVPRADLDLNVTGMTLGGRPLGGARAYVRMTDKEDPWIREALQWEPGSPPPDAECGHGREGLARGVWPEDPPIHTVMGPKPALERPMAYVVCGTGLNGQVAIDMAFGRTKLYPLRGLLQLRGLALEQVLPTTPGDDPLEGTATGRVRLHDGAMLQPETLGGRLTLERLHVARSEVAMRNEGPFDVSFERGGFRVGHAEFTGPASALRISGRGSLTRGLALTLDGSVDLSLLSSLSTTVSQARGHVGVQVKLTGPMWNPSVFGHASLRDGSLRLASFSEPIRDIRGRVTFSDRRITFEGFRAQVAEGSLAVAGSANLSGAQLASYQLDFDAHDLSVAPDDGVEARFDARGALAWARGDRMPELSGTVSLTKLRYTRAIQLGRTLGEMYRSERAEVTRYDPASDRLALDLQVVNRRPLIIDNNLISAELDLGAEGEPIRITGTDQRYGILGRVHIRRGVVFFRDHEFDVRQGEITFEDPHGIEPHFDVRAETEVRRRTEVTTNEWALQLHAHGSRDSFQLDTTSQPYLSDEDIAMLLTVGMTRAEFEQVQTGGDITGTAALEALATVTGVNREVKSHVPAIDDFRIASRYSTVTNRTEPQVQVGKRIADRVRLSAATGLSETREWSTSAEWQLSDQTSVEAIYNNQNASGNSQLGDVGVDLKWRLEFD